MSEKILEEKIINLEQKQNNWLEHFRNWINSALHTAKIARDNDLLQKRSLLKKSLARTSFWPRAKGTQHRKINGRRCAPPTKVGQMPKSQILAPDKKSLQTFDIILPKLIHKSKEKNLKN